MRPHPRTVAQCSAALAIVLSIATAGCSSDEKTAPLTTTTTPVTSTTELPALPQDKAPPAGAVGVSPGGVTTKVDVPAESTESQYGQACHAAKLWFDGQQGDPKTKVETYLQTLQAPEVSGPGNFNTPWAQLTPGQQAGVIMAAQGAANGDCE